MESEISYLQALEWATQQIGHLRDAEDLLQSLLSVDRTHLHLNSQKILTPALWADFAQKVERRKSGEPLLYIIQKTQFYQTQICINSHVLIPRPETEILVERIVKELSSHSLEGRILVDLCTGSGCIGIALKKRFPQLRVILTDISAEALALAQHNAELNKVEVECFLGDFLDPLIGAHILSDFLVSNPPYISVHEWEQLSPEVRDFEPTLALVGGEDGLLFYRRLALDIEKVLKEGGLFWIEIGYMQSDSIKNIFKYPSDLWQDWAGHPRFLQLRLQNSG